MAHKHGKKKLRRITRRDALRLFRGEQREGKQDKLYFGYGSNLDIRQMKRRCKDSVPVVAGSLPGKLLSFSNVLTIEDHESEAVVGGLYEVSYSDERALDRYEGYPSTYSKRYTHITINGERRTVFYYVLNTPYTWSAPTMHYYSIVAQGYRDWGLDMALLAAAHERAEKADKEAERLYRKYERETRLSWKSEPNVAYSISEDGTIDYLDYADATRSAQLDRDWDAAMSRDMESAFKSDYRRYRGW